MARTSGAAWISRSMTYTTDGNSTLFDHKGIGDHEAAGIHEDPHTCCGKSLTEPEGRQLFRRIH